MSLFLCVCITYSYPASSSNPSGLSHTTDTHSDEMTNIWAYYSSHRTDSLFGTHSKAAFSRDERDFNFNLIQTNNNMCCMLCCCSCSCFSQQLYPLTTQRPIRGLRAAFEWRARWDCWQSQSSSNWRHERMAPEDYHSIIHSLVCFTTSAYAIESWCLANCSLDCESLQLARKQHDLLHIKS